MAFNNPRNRCSLTGYVCKEIQNVQNSNAVEFGLAVERIAPVKGQKTYSDNFDIYVSTPLTINFVTTNVKKGTVITVKGEMRVWFDKSIKLCADTIVLKG